MITLGRSDSLRGDVEEPVRTGLLGEYGSRSGASRACAPEPAAACGAVLGVRIGAPPPAHLVVGLSDAMELRSLHESIRFAMRSGRPSCGGEFPRFSRSGGRNRSSVVRGSRQARPVNRPHP
ncbi:hypothetical protein GCM10010319_15990 [Streptomyces blastmyceticus]|uniref:Uncharacterized protein n=1 Tax=Streptomyces blastmyceticus TaxID=68180 RepID=A0ABP3GCU5_9ACTN